VAVVPELIRIGISTSSATSTTFLPAINNVLEGAATGG